MLLQDPTPVASLAGELVESCTILERLNRFVVEVDMNGERVRAHINNTGKLTSVLVKGRRGYCVRLKGRGKLQYRLYAVEYSTGYAVIDTQLQEKAFMNAVETGLIPWLEGCRVARRRPRVLGEVFDYSLSCKDKTAIVELKSAILESPEGYAMYPDTPSERGRRHVRKLVEYSIAGGWAILVFVAAFPGARGFKPNKSVDPEIARLVKQAVEAGVTVESIGLEYKPYNHSVYMYATSLPVVFE